MKKILLVLSIFLIFPTIIFASTNNKIAIGINYPGVNFKYFINKKICIEPKAQFGSDIFTGGIRGNYYFSDLIYSGCEVSYITFKGDVSEGSGIAGSVFGGIELNLLENLTLQLDIGPVFIMLSDKNYDVSENYTEIMGNIGLNYYFK